MEIGVDCIEVARFKGILRNARLASKIFTKKEITYCRAKASPPQHLAARFAGKEAVSKALSGFGIAVPLNKIEISNRKSGLPIARVLDKRCAKLNVRISLSHTRGIAMAFAIIDHK